MEPQPIESLLSESSRRLMESKCGADPGWKIAKLILGCRIEEMWGAVAPLAEACEADATPPIPPDALRSIVADVDPAMFLWTGLVDARMVIEILGRYVPLVHRDEPRRLLDLGGGCGRVSRHLMNASSLRVALADTNPDHVAWCGEHLPELRSFRIPSDAEVADIGRGYECVLAVSVFTHLSSSCFDAWLMKVAGALASRGVGIVTLHGEWSLRYVATNAVLQRYFKFSSEEANTLADELGDRRFVYRPYGREELDAARAGDDYGLTYVSKDCFEEACRRASLEVVDYAVGGLRGWQDVAVVRRSAPVDGALDSE